MNMVKLGMIAIGFVVIIYSAMVIGFSAIPMDVAIPVPWSDKPVGIEDNPQLEAGAVLVILGIVLVCAGFLLPERGLPHLR